MNLVKGRSHTFTFNTRTYIHISSPGSTPFIPLSRGTICKSVISCSKGVYLRRKLRTNGTTVFYSFLASSSSISSAFIAPFTVRMLVTGRSSSISSGGLVYVCVNVCIQRTFECRAFRDTLVSNWSDLTQRQITCRNFATDIDGYF